MTMKRLTVWAISLLLGTLTTFFLFEFTAVAIPFFRGGIYTILSIIFTAILFSIPIDSVLKSGIFDEQGWHLGIFDPMGPLTPRDEPTPKNYQPILSREERRKQQGNS